MLLCDFCESGAVHCSCADPPFSSVPEGKFGCPECAQKVLLNEQYKAEYQRMVDERIASLERKWKSQKESLKQRKEKWKVKQRKRNSERTMERKRRIASANDSQIPVESAIAVEPTKSGDSTKTNINITNINAKCIDETNESQNAAMNLPPAMVPPAERVVMGQFIMSNGMLYDPLSGTTYQQVQTQTRFQQVQSQTQPTSFSNLPPAVSPPGSHCPNGAQSKTQQEKIQSLLVPPAKKTRGRNKEPTYQYDQSQPAVPPNQSAPLNQMYPTPQAMNQQWMPFPGQMMPQMMYGQVGSISGITAQPLQQPTPGGNPLTQSTPPNQPFPSTPQQPPPLPQTQPPPNQSHQSHQTPQVPQPTPSYIPAPPSMCPKGGVGNNKESFDMFLSLLSSSTPNANAAANNPNPPSTGTSQQPQASINVTNVSVTNYNCGSFSNPVPSINTAGMPPFNAMAPMQSPMNSYNGNTSSSSKSPTSSPSSQQRQQGSTPSLASKSSTNGHNGTNAFQCES